MDDRWCAGLLIGTVSKVGANRAQGDPRLTHRGSTEPLLETGAAAVAVGCEEHDDPAHAHFQFRLAAQTPLSCGLAPGRRWPPVLRPAIICGSLVGHFHLLGGRRSAGWLCAGLSAYRSGPNVIGALSHRRCG